MAGSKSATALPLGLSFSDGHGIVTLTRRHRAGFVALEQLEMEIPRLRFPFDASGGVSRFRHRRCQLRKARLQWTEGEVQSWLREASDERQLGLFSPVVRLRHGMFEVAAQLGRPGRGCDLLLRGFVQPGGGRVLQLCLCDLRLYGPSPVPAPLLAGRLWQAIGARPDADPSDPVGLRLVGCCDVQIAPLDRALLHTLPAGGWRLPAQHTTRLSRVVCEPGRLIAEFGSAPGGPATAGRSPARRFVAVQEAKGLFRSLEEALLDSELAAAIDLCRRHRERHPHHPFLIERLLQLTSAEQRYDEEALRLARQAQRSFSEFIPGLLAEANVLVRQGAHSAAAVRYRRLAALAARRDDRLEEELALLAAGRNAMSDDPEAARTDFERVLELRPEHGEALRCLGRIYGELGSWRRLVHVRERQIELAASPQGRLHGHLALGELYRVHLAEPQRARAQYELALELDPSCEPALRGLAEACIDAEDPLRAIRALDALYEIVSHREEIDEQVAIDLRIASLWEHLEDPEAALARLERARQLQPDDIQTRRQLASLLLRMERTPQGAAALRSLLSLLEDPVERAFVHRQLAQLYLGPLDDLPAAGAQLERALTLDSDDTEALRLQVELAERLGEPQKLLEALGRAIAATEPTAQRAAWLLRQGDLMFEAGDLERAEASLELAVEQAADGGWSAHRSLASLAERRGDVARAIRRWRDALATQPGQHDGPGWLALGLLLRSQGDVAGAHEALVRADELLERPPAGGQAASGQQRAEPAFHPRRPEALRALAETCAELDDGPGRLRALEALLALTPPERAHERAELLVALGEQYELEGDAPAALRALQRARELTPDDPVLLETIADLYEDDQQWLEAQQALERAMSLRRAGGAKRDCARLALRVATLWAARNRHEEAIAAFHRALDEGLAEPHRGQAWQRVIELHLRAGDGVSAATACESSAADADDAAERAERYYRAGQLWLKRAGRRQEAVRCFQRAAEIDEHHRPALDVLESLATEEERYDDLVSILELKVDACASQPQLQTALLERLGRFLVRLGRDDEARRAHERSLAIDAEHLPSLLFIARDAWRHDNVDEAGRFYRRAADCLGRAGAVPQRDALQVEIHLRLAELCRRDGDTDQEETHLELVLAAAPHDERALAQLDALLEIQQRVEEQLAVVTRRVEAAAPDRRGELLLRMARLQQRLDRREEALASLRRVLELDPQHVPAQRTIVELLRSGGPSRQLAAAQRQLAEMLSETIHVGTPARQASDGWVALAGVLTRLEDPLAAAEALHRALEIEPANDRALEQLLALARREAIPDDAADLLARRIRLQHDPSIREKLELQLFELYESRRDPERALEVARHSSARSPIGGELLARAAELCVQLERWHDAAALYERLVDERAAYDEKLTLDSCRRLLRIARGPLAGKMELEPIARRLLQLDDSDHQALVALAQVQLDEQRWEQAAELLHRTLASGLVLGADEGLRLRLQLVEALQRSGDRPRARAVLRIALGAAPQHTSALLSIAETARSVDHDAIELEALRGAIAASEEGVLEPAVLRTAELHRARGELRQRRFLLRRLVEDEIAAAPERIEAARLLHDSADRDEPSTRRADEPSAAEDRIAALELLYRTKAANRQELFQLAGALEQAGQPRQALAVARQLVDEGSGQQQRARELLLELLTVCGEFAALAQEHERLAEEQQPAGERAAALLEAARLWLEKAGRVADAERCLRGAVAAAEGERKSTVHRATELLAGVGAWERAIVFAEQLADAKQQAGAAGELSMEEQAELLCRAAELRTRAHQSDEEVAEAYRRVLEHDPDHPTAYEALCAIYRRQSAHERLLELMLDAADRGPRERRLERLLDAAELAEKQLQRADLAAELLERARVLAPHDVRVLETLVRLHTERGELERAESALLDLADAGIDAEQNLGRACGLAHLRGDAAAEAHHLSRLARLKPDDPALSARLLDAFRAAGDLEGLRSSLEQLAEHDLGALQELAQLYAGPLDDPPAAHDAYARLVARRPDAVRAIEGMVAVCERLGNRVELVRYLERLRELQPAEATARRGELARKLAAAHQELGDTERAIDALQAAAADFVSGQRWADTLRELIATCGDHRALEALRALVAANTATDEELLLLAELSRTVGDPQLELHAYRLLLQRDPTHVAGDRAVATLLEQELFEPAAELLEQLAATAQSRDDGDRAASLLLQLSRLFATLGDQPRRQAALQRAHEAAPRRADVRQELVEVLEQSGELQALATVLRDQLEQAEEPESTELLRRLADLYARLGAPASEAELRERLLCRDPEDVDQLLPLLRYRLQRGSRDAARALLDRARANSALTPAQEADAAARLAALDLDAGDDSRARVELDRALELDAAQERGLRLMCELALRAGDRSALGRIQLQLAEKDPEHQREHLRQAASALAGVDHEQLRAIQLYRKLLADDPDDHSARRALEDLLRTRGDDEALAALLWQRFERAAAPAPEVIEELIELETRLERDDRLEQALRAALMSRAGDAQLLHALQGCLRRQAKWEPLASLIERRLEQGVARRELRAQLQAELGELYIDRLQQPDRGVELLEQACTTSSASDHPCRRLLSIYRREQRFSDVAALLRMRIAQLQDGERSDLWEELGRVLEAHLDDDRGAAQAYAAAYREQPEPRLHCADRAQQLLRRLDEPAQALELLDDALTRADEQQQSRLRPSRAEALVQLGRAGEAIAELERALQHDPGRIDLQRDLGELLYREARFHDAIPHLQLTAERSADPRVATRAALLAGRALEAIGMGREAMRRFEQAIELDPTARQAHEALLDHYERAGDAERLGRSLAALVPLVDDGDRRARLLLRLGRLQHHQKDDRAAYASYLRAAETAPGDPDAQRALAPAALALGEHRVAADALERLAECAGGPEQEAEARAQLGRVLARHLDDSDGAVEQLVRAHELAPHDVEATELLLELLERRRQFSEAAKLAQQLVTQLPRRRNELLLRAGSLFERAGWNDEALQMFRAARSETLSASTADDPLAPAPPPAPAAGGGDPAQAAADDPHRLAEELRGRIAAATDEQAAVELSLQLARLLEDELDRRYEALEVYERASASAPEDAGLLEAYADAAYRHQEWPRARDLYDRLYEQASGLPHAELSYRRGVVHEALGYETTADRCYAEAVAVAPKHRLALEARARLALYRDDTETAIEALAQLAKLLTVDELDRLADVRHQLGELHLRRGNLRTAREYLEATLALDPRRGKTMQPLLAVYEQLGDFAAASDLAQRLVYHVDDPLVRASLLHHRAELLASHFGDEDEAIDCLLRAYDITAAHTPTLWRLVDYFWNQRDLDSLTQMTDDLRAHAALDGEGADLRYVYLSVAMLAVRGDRRRAVELLRKSIQDPALLEPVLLELARALEMGVELEPLLAVARSADVRGELRLAAPQTLKLHSRDRQLQRLVDGLTNVEPAPTR